MIVLDVATGKYKRHWGAYGARPSDEPMPAYNPKGPPSKQFNTVHCAIVSNDGFVYVCDRVNDRIQVFRKDGTFVKEAFIDTHTFRSGSVWDMTFSRDPQQTYIYAANGVDEKINILLRSSLEVLTSFGDGGRGPGAVLRRPQPGDRFEGQSLRDRDLHRRARPALPLQGRRPGDEGGAGRRLACPPLTHAAVPGSISDLQQRLADQRYVGDRGLAVSLFLALRLGRPLFLEGEAGVGKTALAAAMAAALGTDLIRLQCYEGLDIRHAVYEWDYPRQLLELRMLEAGGGDRSRGRRATSSTATRS